MNAFRDTRLAMRMLARSPGHAAAVTLILALSIGANAAVFSAVYGVLLKPLPVRDSRNLVVVWDSDRARNLPVVEVSYRSFESWAAHSRSFVSAAAMGSSSWPAILQRGAAPVRVSTAGVSASFFETLGVAPLLGRTLLPEDDRPHASPVAVLSYAGWVKYFGADPAIVGTRVQLDTTRAIVGVMPREFDFPRSTSFWFPVVPLLSGISRPDFDALTSVGVLFVIAWLQPGVTAGTAAQELDRIASVTPSVRGPERFGSVAVATPFLDYVFGPVRQGLWALWSGVGVLLLIACANVSGLMLTRASMRAREDTIRLALGATRLQVARLWLSEASVLATASGVLGLACAWWMTRTLVALAPADTPRLANITVSPGIAVFAMALVFVAALLCGIVPARHAGMGDPFEGPNESAYSSAGPRQHRARSLLLAVQMALAVVLLIATGLVVRSFTALRALDLGFVPADVVTMFVGPESTEGMRRLLEGLEAVPRVEAAGAVYLRPLELGPIGQETAVRLEGQTDMTARSNPALNFQVATPGYFPAIRMRLLRGRFFSDADRAATVPVAIVSETAARRLWPGAEALGKRMRLHDEKEWRTVVGVVGDVHYRGLGDVRPDVYEPASQSTSTPNYLAIRTSGDPLSMMAAVKAEVHRVDPAAVVDSVATLDAIVSRAVAPWRFTSWLLAALASVAFVLTIAGFFSVVSLQVANRRYDLAIRLALGAGRTDLVRSAFGSAALPALAGLGVGALGAAALTSTLRGLLFGVRPFDPITWAGVLLLLAVVAGLAAFLPARRAASVDPSILIRR
jgi:predicted permease